MSFYFCLGSSSQWSLSVNDLCSQQIHGINYMGPHNLPICLVLSILLVLRCRNARGHLCTAHELTELDCSTDVATDCKPSGPITNTLETSTLFSTTFTGVGTPVSLEQLRHKHWTLDRDLSFSQKLIHVHVWSSEESGRVPAVGCGWKWVEVGTQKACQYTTGASEISFHVHLLLKESLLSVTIFKNLHNLDLLIKMWSFIHLWMSFIWSLHAYYHVQDWPTNSTNPWITDDAFNGHFNFLQRKLKLKCNPTENEVPLKTKTMAGTGNRRIWDTPYSS